MIKVGIIGCGGMSWHHLQLLLEIPEIQIKGLVDIKEEALERLKEKFFEPRNLSPATFSDYREMIDNLNLDGVLILTPHTLHYPQAKYALERGLHVLVEKPMVCDSSHAQELIALAEAKKKVLLIAFPGPFSSQYRYAKEFMRNGKLGEIQFVDGFISQDWLKHARGKWRGDPKLSGGGQLYDSGSHLINSILWLTDLEVIEVSAFMDNKDLDVDVLSSLTVRFGNGVLGSILVSGDCLCFRHDIMISGTEGVISCGIYGERMDIFQGKRKVELSELPPNSSPQQNFVNAILNNEEVICPGIYGQRLSELLEAAYRSAKEGRCVKAKSSIINDCTFI